MPFSPYIPPQLTVTMSYIPDGIRSYTLLYALIWWYMIVYDSIWCCMMLYDVIWCRMMSYDVVWWHILAYFGILASTEPPIFPDSWQILWRLCPVLLIDMRYDRKLNGFRRPTISSCFDYLHKFSNDQRHLFSSYSVMAKKPENTLEEGAPKT